MPETSPFAPGRRSSPQTPAAQPPPVVLACAGEDGAQVGAVAFERFGPMLRFLGGTEVTDYLGPVGLAESQPAIAKELFAALAPREDWTEADPPGLPEDR